MTRRFDRAQRPDGEPVEPSGLSRALGLRFGRALRQAQRPTSSATDKLSDRWGNCRGPQRTQGPDGEFVEPVGLSRALGLRWGRALRQAQRPDGATVEDLDGLRERMVSLSNHSGFRGLWGFGGVGRFDRLSDRWATVGDDGLRERMVSLSNHSGFRGLWGFGGVGRFDRLSDRQAQRPGGWRSSVGVGG